MVEFETLEVVSDDGDVMVELEWIGEGNDGDYDAEDDTDKPLLRYSIYRRFYDSLDADRFAELCDTDAYEDGDWAQVRDGSYCTQLEATAPREQLEAAAKFILGHVESGVRELSRAKRLYEKLSWIALVDGQPVCN